MLKLTDEQIEQERRLLEKIIVDAKEQLLRAQERLLFFNELAQREQLEEKLFQKASTRIDKPQPPPAMPTVADAAEEVLTEHKHLTNAALYKLLVESGKIRDTTSPNSLYVTLTKYMKKGQRFQRIGNEWSLMNERKDGPEGTEAVFNHRGEVG